MKGGKRFEVLGSRRGIAACLVALLHLRIFSHGHFADVALIKHSYLFIDFDEGCELIL
jgi:hypothetical protein